MATKSTITTIPDRMDGQPPRLLPNGNLAVFDNTQQVWVDSGVRIVPEDDANAVKYFILTTNSVAPQAPTKQAGWGTIDELNNSLRQAGWDENPVSTTEEKRFCWIAIYGRSNILDPVASAAKKMSVFKPKYTLNTVALWSNYAPSPVITVEAGKIIITNPDGTKIEQEFATSESTDALLKLIQGLQKQVDKAVYAYQGKGAPTMQGSPTNTWLYDAEGQPITQPNMIADVYGTHVGDTYTDLDTTVSYLFVLRPGASASDPASYQWEAIQNTALTKALADIAKMGREKLTIHTEKPINGYKKGDIWLKDENTRLWAIRDNTAFADVDWINPYVNAADFEALKKEFQKLSQQFDTAKNSIKDLTDAMNGVENGVADAFRDSIITEAERRDLSELSKKLDIEQAQLQSNVNYILDNEFLPADLKSELTTKSKKLLAASTGSIDKLQESIATAIADNKITEQERADYNAKYQIYVADVKSLTDCIDKCRQAIDKKIKQAAADDILLGERNLLLKSNVPVSNSNYLLKEYDISEAGRNLEAGETATVVIAGNLSEGKQSFLLYNSGGIFELAKVIKDKLVGGIACVSFKWKTKSGADVGNNTKLSVYAAPNSGTGESSISWIKLVRGNKTSLDWTEAPEDIESRLNAIKAIKMPEIDPVTKNWKLWSDEQKTLVDSGLSSKGDNGNSPYISQRTKTWWEYDAENPTAQVQGEKRGYKDTGIKVDGVAVRPNILRRSMLPANFTWNINELPGKTNKYSGNTGKIEVFRFGQFDDKLAGLIMSFKISITQAEQNGVTFHRYANFILWKKDKATPFRTVRVMYEMKPQDIYVTLPIKVTKAELMSEVYFIHAWCTDYATSSGWLNAKIEDIKIEQVLEGEPEIPTAYIPHVEDLKGETGEAGESSLDVEITVRGRFHTSWEQADESGQILDMPRPVRSVVNGVRIGGKDYVQLKARITYGLKDITAVAMNNGGAFKWLVNGQVLASNTDTLNVGTEYADGVDDNVEFKYDDTNIKQWIQ
ncbi:hypothetical protein [Bacteroides pyogenes]|uniref:hypothetical protein n=1 Tax=Bacteroides pyogenes TaxID=310300 RepID=UPI000E140AFD|nr:hypothetical protein [Bacteroides pyogenes]MBB3894400.1 hypothetical protein [Bacteroides pyogenes]SUV35505.1 Uncharacterised protein [Bacteroides pyogenes]